MSIKMCSSSVTSLILSPLPGACSRSSKAPSWAEWDNGGVGKAAPRGGRLSGVAEGDRG